MFQVGSDQFIPRRYTDLTTAGIIYANYVPGYGVLAYIEMVKIQGHIYQLDLD